MFQSFEQKTASWPQVVAIDTGIWWQQPPPKEYSHLVTSRDITKFLVVLM